MCHVYKTKTFALHMHSSVPRETESWRRLLCVCVRQVGGRREGGGKGGADGGTERGREGMREERREGGEEGGREGGRKEDVWQQNERDATLVAIQAYPTLFPSRLYPKIDGCCSCTLTPYKRHPFRGDRLCLEAVLDHLSQHSSSSIDKLGTPSLSYVSDVVDCLVLSTRMLGIIGGTAPAPAIATAATIAAAVVMATATAATATATTTAMATATATATTVVLLLLLRLMWQRVEK